MNEAIPSLCRCVLGKREGGRSIPSFLQGRFQEIIQRMYRWDSRPASGLIPGLSEGGVKEEAFQNGSRGDSKII